MIAEYGPTYTDPLNGLIVKFNNLNGSAVWVRTYTGLTGASYFFDVKIDRQNNIYVAGVCDTAHLLIRYNVNGDTLWVRRYYPPSTSEVIYGCNFDDSLNIVFTGVRRHYYGLGSYDSVLAGKYTQGGTLRWENTYANGYTTNVGKKIVTDQNGSLYIGGATAISGFPVFLTMKFDRNGVMQWAKIYDAPGNGDNNLRGIAMDRINNTLFVTGSSQMSGTTDFGITIKYDALNGDSIWVVKYGTNNFISGFGDIRLDILGNAYVTGGTGPYNSTGDVLTIKYSPQGSQVWLTTFNGPYNGADGAYSLSLDSANNVYVMGASQSASQIFDYIVIKYNQISGIKPISNEIPKVFSLGQNYPNPFNPSTVLKFQVASYKPVKITIYDILGHEIETLVNRNLQPGTYEINWNAANYASGVYFYQMIVDGNIIDTKKLALIK